MTAEELIKTILVEIHRIIETSAANGVQKIGQPYNRPVREDLTEDEIKYLRENKNPDLTHPAIQKMLSHAGPKLLIYPPKDVLTEEEERQLSLFRLSEVQRSALQKLIADSCASAFFGFFCLLDGVGDPEISAVDHWCGAKLVEGMGDSELHDEFVASYWDYERITGN
jgi:hypothetical protein